MNKLFEKLIAVMLVITLAGANLILLGAYGVTYALSDSELAEQNTATQNENVEFNAYLEGGGHTVLVEPDHDEIKLYLNIKVKSAGYVKNATVTFQDANFKINENLDNEFIQNIDVSNNKITLKQMNNGSDVTIELIATMKDTDTVPVDNFSKESKTIFNGTYFDKEGNENQISKEIVNKISWKREANATIKSEITKYIPYAENEKYGVLVQAKVNSGIQDSKLPIKETNIEVTAPEIKGQKPNLAFVSANQTIATNGAKDGLNFGSDQYTYDLEKGILSITTKNEADAKGQISWKKDGQDEYLVTFIFEGKEVYDEVMENHMNAKMNLVMNATLYNNEETTVQTSIAQEVKLENTIGTFADFSITASKEIAKGQIYANYDAKKEDREETNYKVQYQATISYLDITDSIEFVQGIDSFIRKEDEQKGLTTLNDKNYVYNKAVKVNKDIFIKMLGQEGNVDILDKKGTILGTINQMTKEDDNGNYVLDISKANNNELTIQTSKPISVGTFTVEVEKAVSKTIDYSKKQMQNFKAIGLSLTGKASTAIVDATESIDLKEVASVASVEISPSDLSTAVENKKVELRAVLDTSSISNALFKDPTLKIKMPSYIDKMVLKNAKLIMDGGLKIKEVKAKKENDAIILDIALSGTQTQYTVDAEYKGTILVIEADITAKTLTPNGTEKIEMTFTNKNGISTNSSGKVETQVKFVAPAGVVVANGIANFAKGAKAILSITDEKANATIETYSEKQIATVTGKIINNYENNITDIVVLGRLPAKDNSKIDESEKLGSTFDAVLAKAISVTGIDQSHYTIYYSDKADATQNLQDVNNGWKTEATKSAKSYLIVTKDYEMEPGKVIDFCYDIEIPANLSYNNSAYEMYKVYYNNVSDIGTMAETKVSPIVETSTGEGPELEISLSSASNTVREGQIVTIKATVKNVGEITAKNAKLLITAPEGTLHTELRAGKTVFTNSEEPEKEIALGDIKAGETVVKEYQLSIKKGVKIEKVEHDEEDSGEDIIEIQEYPGDKDISNTVRVSAENISNSIQSEPYILRVLKGDLKITNVQKVSSQVTLRKGSTINYIVRLDNISYTDDLKNVTLHVNLPKGIKINNISYIKYGSGDKITEGITINDNSATVNVGELKSFVKSLANEETSDTSEICNTAEVTISCTVGDFVGDYDLMMTASADNMEEHYSNIQKIATEKVELEIKQKELDSNYVKEGTEFTYHFTVKNVGDIASNSNIFKIKLPEGLSFVKAQYEIDQEKGEETYINDDREVSVRFFELQPGKTANISVTVKADLLPTEEDKQIIVSGSISAYGFVETQSNEVKVVVEYDKNAHQNGFGGSGSSSSGNQTAETYKIAGTAWLDANKDGQRDETETLLSNIPVVLIYKKNNSIVKDPDTKQEMRTTTNSAGTYQFNNVPAGEYLVLFLYDAANYSLTTYKADGVAETVNSDAIDINITFDNLRRVAGITDVVKVTDANVRDIDIGLYTAQKFDLKIDKYVSKISRTTPTSGTNTFNYTQESGKVVKVEVLPSNVGQSDVVIEYTFVITNEGAVSGYAKKIVDYLPEHVNFNTELNSDWYLSENGNIYNASLENEIIQPGESKEVKLILSVRMTESNLGNLNNNAEIYESYNEQGLQDIDSTAGNKATDEDDISSADVVLSLVTGRPFEYVTLILGIVVLIGFGVFFIKKCVLTKGKD